MVLMMTRLPDTFPTKPRDESAQEVGSQNSPDLSAQMKFLYDYRNAGHSCCLGHWALSRESLDFWGHPAWGWACLPAHTSFLFPLSSVEALFKLFKWPQGCLHFEDISHNLTVINGLCWLFLSLCWRFPGNFSLVLIWSTGGNSLSSHVMESALSFKTLKQRHVDKDGWDKDS